MHVLAALLTGLSVASGAPFAGDDRLRTTVSPNGDGVRDAAVVRFRLARSATVTLEAVRTDTIRVGRAAGETIWSRRWRLPVGVHALRWRPARSTAPRTYLLRVSARSGRRSIVYGSRGPGRRRLAPVVRVQGVDAGFTERSYAAGEAAELELSTDARGVRLQVYAYSTTMRSGDQDFKTSGEAMTPSVLVDWTGHRNAPSSVRVVRAGPWPSGLYFVRATATDGRVGYAPFILRPRRFGELKVAVVLSTNTWQAYNFHDDDGDGWGDSWYVSDSIHRVDLQRPYLDFGIPFRYRDWDLAFIAWLNRTGKQVEFLSDDDLERFRTGDDLAAAYDLVVFPGHAEYVTSHAYDVVERYRDRGGNLMFLSANNFFWRVRRDGHALVKDALWRDLGRPEAALVGVQYVGSDGGIRQAPYTVSGAAAAPWAFAGTGFEDGSIFGSYGIEIDARSPASPPGTLVLAQALGAVSPTRAGEMTYYETPAGAKVFAAGTLNFAASIDEPPVTRLVENVWAWLASP
jgi:hypothetical protein